MKITMVGLNAGNEASAKPAPVGLYSLAVVANWPCGMRQAPGK